MNSNDLKWMLFNMSNWPAEWLSLVGIDSTPDKPTHAPEMGQPKSADKWNIIVVVMAVGLLSH